MLVSQLVGGSLQQQQLCRVCFYLKKKKIQLFISVDDFC